MQTISPATHGAIIGFTDTAGIHLILQGLQDENLIKWHAAMGPQQHVELTVRGWSCHKELSASAATDHQLVAILSTDVVGSTALMAADEHGTLAALQASMSMLRETVGRHGGRLVKTTGDGTLCEFESTLGAMRAALEIQNAMMRQNVGRSEGKLVLLRIGLVVGDVSPEGDDIMGDSVNLAARLQSAAEPGTVYTTEHVRDDLANKMALSSMDLGQMTFKGIGRPVRVVKITPPQH